MKRYGFLSITVTALAQLIVIFTAHFLLLVTLSPDDYTYLLPLIPLTLFAAIVVKLISMGEDGSSEE